jgi:hypothetical protein
LIDLTNLLDDMPPTLTSCIACPLILKISIVMDTYILFI